MAERDDRVTLTIPYPSDIPRTRGIHSTNHSGLVLKARVTQVEEKLIQLAADQIGIPKSQMIRWSTVMVAREIMRYQNDPDIIYPEYCTSNSST